MKLKHIALASPSEVESDRFFMELLGLEKIKNKTVSKDLSNGLFNLEREFQVIDYGNEDVKFEVFIDKSLSAPELAVGHTCLETGDRDEFLSKAEKMGYQVRRMAKGEKVVVFVKDSNNNLFEIT